MTAAVLSDAIESGAELVVSACTVSHINLDSYQSKAGRRERKEHFCACESSLRNRCLCSWLLSRPTRTTADPSSSHRFLRGSLSTANNAVATALLHPALFMIWSGVEPNKAPKFGLKHTMVFSSSGCLATIGSMAC